MSYQNISLVSSQQNKFLEILLSIICITVIVLFFLNKVLQLTARSEQESVIQTLSVLRAGIQVHVLKKIVEGKIDYLPRYENTNPMKMMSVSPLNYLGEKTAEELSAASAGNWYFDINRKELVYKIVQSDGFLMNGKPLNEARFFVKFAYKDNDKNNFFDKNIDDFKGLVLIPKKTYSWLN